MSTTSIIILSTFVSIALSCSFAAGIYYERIQWNKLINEGRLPKPKTHLD